MKRSMLATAFVVAATSAALAQAPVADDPHHHAPSAAAPAQPAPPAAQPGAGGMPMMNMMGGAPMMGMMQMMRMMGSGMGGIDHVEGRIAFLRTELKITETQTGAWNAFADALRSNAKKLGEMRGAMMPGTGPQHAPSMSERLDLQEKLLLARLESTRTMKSAVAGLYGALSDDQKKTADDLLAPHMGMGMRSIMMGQMQPGQAAQGQMMQPGPMMRPGQMMQPAPTPPSGK
ncbi:MAG TPA: Spy/CpxP family protein refolding chaperone [Xanthobacteraceae bacterium]